MKSPPPTLTQPPSSLHGGSVTSFSCVLPGTVFASKGHIWIVTHIFVNYTFYTVDCVRYVFLWKANKLKGQWYLEKLNVTHSKIWMDLHV